MENISLRNYFAAAAMQTLLAETGDKRLPVEKLALDSFEIADAMIDKTKEAMRERSAEEQGAKIVAEYADRI